MTEYIYDYNPAEFLTINTVGEPGQRTFILQAGRYGFDYFTVVCEKEQARALAEGLLSLLEQVSESSPLAAAPLVDTTSFELQEPIIPTGRMGNLGVGYDEDSDAIVLLVQLITPEDEEDGEVARIAVDRDYARRFALHTLEVVAAGRPLCPFCGQPIEASGHVCGGSNGHSRDYMQ